MDKIRVANITRTSTFTDVKAGAAKKARGVRQQRRRRLGVVRIRSLRTMSALPGAFMAAGGGIKRSSTAQLKVNRLRECRVTRGEMGALLISPFIHSFMDAFL